MALVLADRVKDTTTTTGQGTVTLSGTAPAGFQNFSAIGDGNTTYYTIAGGSEWEVGIGTYTSSGTTLSRDTVLSSSAGGTTKVTFSAGTKDVFVTYPAERSVNLNGSALTSGRVPYATTNGLLTDASGFTFSGTALTFPSPFTLGSTSVTTTGTQLNYLNAATGTTGTTSSNVVFSASPTLSGTVGGALTFSGALTLSAALTYGGVTLSNSVTGTGSMVLGTSPTISEPTCTSASANNCVILQRTGSSAGSARIYANSGDMFGVNDGTNYPFRVVQGASTDTLVAGTASVTVGKALVYGGVTLSNAVTGTGNMVLSASPTLTGTLTGAAANFSGNVSSATEFRLAQTYLRVATVADAGGWAFGGGYNFAFNSGVGWKHDSTGALSGISFNNAGSIGFFAAGSAAAGTAATAKMTLDSSGNLGIGTTNPVRKLLISNGGAEGFEFGPGESSGRNVFLNYNRNTSAYVDHYSYALNHVWLPNGTEKMRLDSSGNLGLGMTPTYKLDVTGGSNTTIARLVAGNGSYGKLDFEVGAGNVGSIKWDNTASANTLTYNTGGGAQIFQIASSEKARFGTDGSFLVGTTTNAGAGNVSASAFIPSGSSVPTNGMYLPSANLVSISSASTRVARFFYSSGANWGAFGGFAFVAGNANGSYPVGGYGCRPAGTANSYTYDQSDYAAFIQYGNGGKLDTYTAASGTVGNTISPTAGPYLANLGTSWTNSSDARLKDQFTALSGVLDKLANIVVGTYVWSGQGQSPAGRSDLGIRAQELHAQFPMLVDKGDDSPTWDNETSQRWGINESKVGIVALQGVKELLDEVRALADRISALEA